MRKLIVEEWLSLDGYANDKNGELNFFPSPEQNRYADEDQLKFLDTIDTMILGRKTYELFVEFWPTASVEKEIIADKLNSLNKIVISGTLQEAPWGQYPDATILSTNIVESIKDLKAQKGKDIVLWGSISLAQTLINEHLVDEYRIQLCPTTTGGGRLLFPGADSYKNLRLTDLKKYDTGVVFLNYQPA